MAPYRNCIPELKFFGTMNGDSDSHTNAFFCPDDETIVFLDMSALNSRRAALMLKNMPYLKNFYACVTHTHVDHASGLSDIAWAVKTLYPGKLLKIITDRSVADDLLAFLDSCGMRPIHDGIGHEDAVYELLSFDMLGDSFSFYDRHGKSLAKKLRPNWFIRTLPTTHSLRVKTTGFAFWSHEKLVVYSGDTNELMTFMNFLFKTLGPKTDEGTGETIGDHVDHTNDPPIEFYLDMGTREVAMHLNFAENAAELKVLLDEYPTMTMFFMHYDNRELLRRQVEEMLPDMLGERVIITYQSV